MASKNLSISEVEKILKKQKIVFAFLNCSVKGNSLYQNYCLPLKKLFGKIILFDPLKIMDSYGHEKMQEIFLSLIKKEKPEYIFLNGRRDELTIETIERIKKLSPNTKIIAISGDDDKDFEPLKRYHALFMDCTLIHQVNYLKNYYKDGVKNIYPAVGINTEIFKPINAERIYDVTFMGNATEERIKIIRFLIKNGINLKIVGGRWGSEFKEFCLGYLSPEEAVKIINQSKINLALSKNKYGKPSFKWRVFEIAACKSFSLVDYFSEYFKFFKNNKEIMMFKDDNDLLKKIKYYLKHEKEREEIAENSYKKAIKNHNVLKEFKEVFKTILENLETFSQKFPQIKEKSITLKKEYFEKSNKEIEESLKKFDYISFSDGNSIPLKHKEYLQAYSLNKTKKSISCCDCYVYDKILGNYLTTNVFRAFPILKADKFNQAISLNQIMVSKDYFIKNLNKFREFFNGNKIDIINEKNTAFISIPLVKINKINKMDLETFSIFFHQKNFIFDINLLLKQKRLFASHYFYRLIYLLLKKKVFRDFFIKFVKERLNKR